ncbi:MAG: 6-bladed beta-propeller [Tannerellaceae bacterium]|jgi:hypothetical protein|nr:6-bladed beta-propeller [Tannerellaceae bacterium]
MKKPFTILATILPVIAGCAGCSRSGALSDEIITVDVTAGYPAKELVLQDFMDVEYIPLETTEEFVTQDLVLDISRNRIILRNHPEDGNIFIFDRNGKALKRINRKGQGTEEYTVYMRVALDEDNGELFVNDRPRDRIVVYDMDGNFRRILKQDEKVSFGYMYNLDNENLICSKNRKEQRPFAVISRRDGSVTGEIQIPFKEGISTTVEFEMNGGTYTTGPDTYKPVIPCVDGLILTEESSDTVYMYRSGHRMTPVIVRTPPVESMAPRVFLFPSLFTGGYYFMDAVKTEIDLSKDEWFPTTRLVYDRQEKAIFRYTVYNDDYTDRTPVMIDKSIPIMNGEIAACQSLDVGQLIEDYENGKLKGRLKEVAAGLDEESNPVIMLIKHKKP